MSRNALDVAHRTQQGATVVTPRGLLDLSSYPQLRDTLLKCAADAPTALVVDLVALDVDRISSLSVFPTVWIRTSVWPGVPLLLAGARAPLDKMLAASALPRFVACHRTTAEALDAVGAPPPRRRAEIELPPAASSSSIARHWTAEQLDRFEVPDGEVAVLVACELVENTLRHTRSACRLRLELHPAGLSVAVSDDDPRPPRFTGRVTGAAREKYGLTLVDLFARACGHSPRWNGGKVVWAVLPMQGGPNGQIDPPEPVSSGAG